MASVGPTVALTILDENGNPVLVSPDNPIPVQAAP